MHLRFILISVLDLVTKFFENVHRLRLQFADAELLFVLTYLGFWPWGS